MVIYSLFSLLEMVIFHALSSYVNVYQRLSLFIAISEAIKLLEAIKPSTKTGAFYAGNGFENDPDIITSHVIIPATHPATHPSIPYV
jgi:hypothetical protein